jgi:hypothetical protein
MEQIQSQEQWVLHRLEKFYTNPENLKKVSDILNGTSTLSLRLIDWFVTNYAKKFNVAFMTKNQRYIIVYLSYKSHLKAYSKKMFDPFCRCKRIKFNGLDTTVGQLNFFEWILTDEIIDFLEANREKVHADMESRLQELKETVDKDTRRKRHELSNSATNSLSRHDVTLKVSFD